MLALDFLRLLLADGVLLGGAMSLIGPPPLGVQSWEPTWLPQAPPCQNDRGLPIPQDRRQHGPAVLIQRGPSPAWRRVLTPATPQRSACRRQATALGHRRSAPELALHVLGGHMLPEGLMHLLEVRGLFWSSFMTVVGLTCNTRAVAPIPLAFRARPTLWRLTSGECPA